MLVKSITTLLLLGLSVCSLDLPGMAQAEGVAVVVNSGNPAGNLSLGDLRKMFAGTKRSWPGGQAVKLITRGPGCPERAALLRLLAMSESEYKQYWTAQVFRGEADAEPVALFSNGMQKEAVTAYPGALALVSSQDIKAGMKVVRVNGHAPGEAGYPLN